MRPNLSLILSLIPLLVYGSDTPSEMMNDLTKDMETITQTAKQQRANINYLPYIMSVFEGKELSEAGAGSLKEALGLVAGVNITRDNLSLFNPVFRGSNPVAYGQSKLIIDGVEVNDLFFDGYTAYLAMPIDMIKRIEIVRGPGSYSDGHWGYAGSIIVTTYKGEPTLNENGKWFASAGTYRTFKTGGTLTTRHDDLIFSADVYTIHDNLSLKYGYDGMSNGLLSFDSLNIDNRSLSRSGSAPSSTDTTMVSASLTKGDFFIDGRLSSYRHGSEGGINYALASDGDHYNVNQWHIRGGAHYRIGAFSGLLQGELMQDSFVSHSLLAPEGFVAPSLTSPLDTNTTYTDGFYGIHEAHIRTYRLNTALSGNVYDGDLTFGITGSHSNVVSEKTVTTDRDTGVGLTDYSTTLPFFNPDGCIKDIIAYINYEKAISPSWTGYVSLTVDHRNGLPWQVDPRIASVYALDTNNLLKLSVSRAHRNPSWQEMFTLNNKARWGNPDLNPETVMAYETQFIHLFDPDHTLSIDLFRLNNKDQIYPSYNVSLARYEYVNGLESMIQGLEAEWRKRYDSTTFYAAYTHIWAEDGEGNTLPNAPHDTARGFITHEFDNSFYGSLAGRWQSATPRAASDPRSSMNAIGIVDLSVGYTFPAMKSELQLSIKNIFDQTESYPSPSGTYDDDYPSIGRTVAITFRGSF